MNKREEKKRLIILTAFKVWGRTYFRNTSLSILADALGMTKTAIYRYFPGKDALVESMTEFFLDELNNILVFSSSSTGKCSFEKAVINYTDTLVRFMAENYDFYKFFMVELYKKNLDIRKLLNLSDRQVELLLYPDTIHKEYGFSYPEAGAISGFVHSISSFLLNRKLFVQNSYSKKEAGELLKITRHILLYGIGKQFTGEMMIDYEKIEANSEVQPDEVMEMNRVFTAVSEVIAERGIWNTTVESVADRLNMKKSSLYFYFDNKDRMISEVIEKERYHLGQIISKKASQVDGFEEQLYTVFYVLNSYFQNKPSIFAVMNWLRFQDIRLNYKPPENQFSGFVEFLHLGEKHEGFNPAGFSVDLIAKGIIYLAVHETWSCIERQCCLKDQKIRLRIIHKLLLRGIKGIS